jgi:hypothetical protein
MLQRGATISCSRRRDQRLNVAHDPMGASGAPGNWVKHGEVKWGKIGRRRPNKGRIGRNAAREHINTKPLTATERARGRFGRRGGKRG